MVFVMWFLLVLGFFMENPGLPSESDTSASHL